MFKTLHTMPSRLKDGKGFTLIELMIVVAIIGILAAIAIPNFLTYQIKSKQSEAKTNTMGIKTAYIAFSAERGCYPGIAADPAAAPVGASKMAWVVPAALTAGFCVPAAGGGFVQINGTFADIGFAPSGNVFFTYGVTSNPLAAGAPLVPGGAAAAGPPPVNACAAGLAAIPAPGGAAANAGFQVHALGNLDGNAAISHWSSDDATGATDCTPGIF
jgi:type IV pilus assembly protein PilA